MKRFVLIIVLFCLNILSIPARSAFADLATDISLPFTYSGHTYDSVVGAYFGGSDGAHYAFYNSSEVTLTSNSSTGIDFPGGHTYGLFSNCTGSVPSSCSSSQNWTSYATSNFSMTSTYLSNHDIWRNRTYLWWWEPNVLDFPANYPPSYQLTVNINPSTGGTVSSSPAGVFCPMSSCQKSFSGNVQITATSSSLWSFGYWDDGTICSTDNPLTVNMSGNKTVNAMFYSEMKMPLPAEKHWLLSVEAGGQVQCNGGTDTNHTGTSYYALDFTDNTQEDGSLEGTDVSILAAAGGTVTESSCTSPSWGCTVVIDHGNNYSTRYAHMKTAPLVSQNDTVTRGQQIGIMGTTGNSTGIHLHFQVYHNSDSSSTDVAVKAVSIDGRKLDDYKVGCNNFYLSTNE